MQPIEFKTGVIRPIQCFKEGWTLIKDQYWLFLGISLVGGLLAAFSMYILLGAMFCGIYYCLLRKSRNQPFSFADLFKGFDNFGASLVVALFFIVPNIIIMIMNFGFQIAMPMIIRENGGNTGVIWTIFGIYMVIALVLGILMCCLHALIIFAFPLIVEYKLSGMEAFKLSARAAMKNPGGVVGLILCQFGLMFVGLLACYFGIIFVLPLLYAGIFVAYRKVFPSNQAAGFNEPPPPYSFQDAGQPL